MRINTRSATATIPALLVSAALITLNTTAPAFGSLPTTTSPNPDHVTIMYGDFDGDQQQDRATLATTSGQCSVTFEYSAQPHAKTRRILKPGGQNVTCPDVTASADVNGDGTDSLLLAWSSTSPLLLANPTAGNQNLLIANHTLTNITVRPGTVQPSLIGAADFTGDGKANPWTWSDQDSTLTAWHADGSRALWRTCADARNGNMVMTDANGDGAQDVISAAAMCDGQMFAASAVDGKTGHKTSLAGHTTEAVSVTVHVDAPQGSKLKNRVTVTRGQFDGANETIVRYAHSDGTWHPTSQESPVAGTSKSAARSVATQIVPAKTGTPSEPVAPKSVLRRATVEAGLLAPAQFAQHFSVKR